MKSQSVRSKVRETHLARKAVIYVRTAVNAANKFAQTHDSLERQLSIRDVAIRYGWPSRNVVIFQDIDKPGDTTEDREAYTKMLQEIAARRAGAVLFADATRVTRSASEWQKFCSLCEAADTLLISELGVYDLRNPADKLLLSSSDVTTELDLTVTRKGLRE